ncbi:hypothetical protein B0H14DRAFT_2556870 [Mycena olivaceomarginata]|nr:hypothetical protein B0H14DRAFT_2556870 [Mycena olivaceomarginata]
MAPGNYHSGAEPLFLTIDLTDATHWTAKKDSEGQPNFIKRVIERVAAYTNEIVGYHLGEFITPFTDTDSKCAENYLMCRPLTHGGKCYKQGEMKCVGNDFATCDHGYFVYPTLCKGGRACREHGGRVVLAMWVLRTRACNWSRREEESMFGIAVSIVQHAASVRVNRSISPDPIATPTGEHLSIIFTVNETAVLLAPNITGVLNRVLGVVNGTGEGQYHPTHPHRR